MFLICLRIFFARIVDVSIGTARTILMVRGKRKITAVLAFFEVIIWFYIAREALDLANESIFIPLSYAGGFAAGTYIGTYLTNRFINGYIGVQVITKMDNDKLINKLRKEGYGVSVVNLKKEKNKVKKDMLFIEIKKKSLDHLVKIVKNDDKKSFIVVNDRKYVQNGIVK